MTKQTINDQYSQQNFTKLLIDCSAIHEYGLFCIFWDLCLADQDFFFMSKSFRNFMQIAQKFQNQHIQYVWLIIILS